MNELRGSTCDPNVFVPYRMDDRFSLITWRRLRHVTDCRVFPWMEAPSTSLGGRS
jgi:hypothetical protein